MKATVAYDGEAPSVWHVFPAALYPEREAAELFGMRSRAIRTRSGCSPPKASTRCCASRSARRGGARRDGRRAAGPMPPRAASRARPAPRVCVASRAASTSWPPSTSCSTWDRSIRPRTACCTCCVELDGEEVIAAEASLGYLHRGIEKLAESRRYHQMGTLLDRADYVSGMHTETAFALAAEKLAGIEVPRKASWLRSLVMELNRYREPHGVARHVRPGRRGDGAVPLHHARPRDAPRHPRGDHAARG